MSFDGVFTHSMVHELNQLLTGGRLSKIQQPYDMEVILVIRSQRKNHKLLLSAHPTYARVQLTEIPYENPTNPPNFAMMLRKYLEGGILEKIEQMENDRVIHFHFSKRNELGDLENLVLIVELMGRHSTILLMNQKTGLILDAIKHVGPSQNTYRLLLPGVSYQRPPVQEVKNPFTVDDEALFQFLNQQELTQKTIQQHFQGMGFDTAEELSFRLKKNEQNKLKTWREFFASLNTPKGTLAEKNGKEFFTPIPYMSLENGRTFNSLSELLDNFYQDKAQKDRVKQLGTVLISKMQNEHKKNQKKLLKLEKTLKETENAEDYRRKGELLTTFLHLVPKGKSSVTLNNYYEEDAPLSIPLRVDLSPNQNAQKYFQKYQKAKNAVKIVTEQIKETKQDILYIESVLDQLALASPLEMNGIKEELIATGYLKPVKNKKKRKETKETFQTFTSSDGTTILVGRNNLQNDQLTLKIARKTDTWLHVKNIPGSHVIIKDNNPSETTLNEAAEIAAFFSKYRHSANVPVDYVKVKYIHKPNGAKPGYVIYENQNTLYVTPKENLVKQLKAD